MGVHFGPGEGIHVSVQIMRKVGQYLVCPRIFSRIVILLNDFSELCTADWETVHRYTTFAALDMWTLLGAGLQMRSCHEEMIRHCVGHFICRGIVAAKLTAHVKSHNSLQG
jgi:hypothetical protein